MRDKGSARACDACLAAPARRLHPSTGERLCLACSTYEAGRMAGQYEAAREALTDAVVALSGLGLPGADVLGIVRGELTGDHHRISVERDHSQDSRPWERMFERTEEGT